MAEDFAPPEIDDNGAVRADRDAIEVRGLGNACNPSRSTCADENDRDADIACM